MNNYQYVVSSDDIFRFAHEQEGLDSNDCNEIFFESEVLTLRGWNQFELDEAVHNDGLAWEILANFMTHLGLTEMLVVN